MAVVDTRDLRKRYQRIEALGGVTLKVERGEIYGLLGQNGAGKTTLIKILLGIARGWQGEASLLGEPAGTVHVRSRVGYLPEDHSFPDYHTGYSLLDYYGQLLGVPRTARQRLIPEILELVGIAERRHYKIRTYSKGMKQRLGIAQALMHDPEVIFLDEPTDGVDPVGRRDIREMLLRLKARGRTIFINSHLLGEVELICDRVAILRKGLLIREGDVATLTRQKGRFLIGLAPEQQLPIAELQTMGYAVEELGERWEVQLEESQNIDAIVDLIRARGLNLRHLVEKRQTLEDLFLATHSAGRPEKKRRRSEEEEPIELKTAVEAPPMKYFAILRDSIREARDSKMLYVLLCLSTIAILVVASFSFTPLSAERTFAGFFNGQINSALTAHDPVARMEQRSRQTSFIKLEKVEQVGGAEDSPRGEYVLTVLHHDVKQGGDQVRKAREEVRNLFETAQDLDLIQVTSIVPAPWQGGPGNTGTQYRVTVQGTSRTSRLWLNQMILLFGAFPMPEESAQMLGFQVFMLAQYVISLGSWGAVLMGVVITSFFIPNMLRKGTVDLLLSKPIHRPALLTYKYVGGLSFIFLVTAYAIGGIWLVLGIRTGVWGYESLLLIPSITFFFAILYAVSTLVAVMTRSAITCILLTFGAWFLFFVIGNADEAFRFRRAIEKNLPQPVAEEERWGDGRIAKLTAAIHTITPRTADLNRLNLLIIYCGYVTGSLSDLASFNEGGSVWWESLLVSAAWIAVFVGISCAWFSTKDY